MTPRVCKASSHRAAPLRPNDQGAFKRRQCLSLAKAVKFATAAAGGEGDDAPARTNREGEGGERTTRAPPSTTTTESSRDGERERRPGALGAVERHDAAGPSGRLPCRRYEEEQYQRRKRGSQGSDREKGPGGGGGAERRGPPSRREGGQGTLGLRKGAAKNRESYRLKPTGAPSAPAGVLGTALKDAHPAREGGHN